MLQVSFLQHDGADGWINTYPYHIILLLTYRIFSLVSGQQELKLNEQMRQRVWVNCTNSSGGSGLKHLVCLHVCAFKKAFPCTAAWLSPFGCGWLLTGVNTTLCSRLSFVSKILLSALELEILWTHCMFSYLYSTYSDRFTSH